MTVGNAERHRLLCELLNLDRAPEGVAGDLAPLGWDSDEELVTLDAKHLIDVLKRFESGALSADEVERWANAIECREDIGLAPARRELLKSVLFELANPTLHGPLSIEVAKRMLSALRAAGG